MRRTAVRFAPAVALFALGVALFVPRIHGQNTGQPSTKNGEWPMYTADLSGSKYSPLDQINASNFSKLEVAWRFKTDNLGPRPENKLEGTPIMVKGTVYATAGTRRTVVALNGEHGRDEVDVRHGRGRARHALGAPSALGPRCSSYWTDGRGDERILYVTTGYRLVELNAKTGAPDHVVRHERRRRPEGRRGHRQGQADRSREGRNRPPRRRRPSSTTPSSSGRRCSKASATDYSTNAKGPGPRVRREDRQAALALQHDSRARRVRQRHLGERVVGMDRQRRRLDADFRRPRSRPRLPAGRNADHRRVRRQPSRQQPVRREPRGRRPEDRRPQVALPDGAPRALGQRQLVGLAPD